MRSDDVFILDENSEELGIEKSKLMENAGAAVAREAIRMLNEQNISFDKANVLILAGIGNNGGDGFVAARHLTKENVNVTVLLIGQKAKIRTKIAMDNWNILENLILKVNLIELKDSSEISTKVVPLIKSANLIIDAILGTGVKGELREPIRSIVKLVNESNKPILAIDTPTGINPDTGKVAGTCIKATVTVTFHDIKDGLVDNPNAGKVIVAPIGIPYEANLFVGKGDVKIALKKRSPDSHKGDFGYVVIIGGSKFFTGAPTLAALAALRTGSDVVIVITPSYVANTIRSFSPALIVREFDGEFLNKNALPVIRETIKKADAVIFGPGMSLNEDALNTAPEVFSILKKQNIPAVIDADALKVLAKNPEFKNWDKAVITPHLGEFKLFLSQNITTHLDTLTSKMAVVEQTSKGWGLTVLLKGRYDIISNGVKTKINKTGNPGMTVGGTGDVLTGIIGALLANKIDIFRAACIGAYLNGRAGDLAAQKLGYHLTPIDVVSEIPYAIEYTIKE